MLHGHGSPKPTTCFYVSLIWRKFSISILELFESQRRKNVQNSPPPEAGPYLQCGSIVQVQKHVDQLVLRTPSFPWVTLKTIAKENILTLKARCNALLEHLVWKLHRFPSWSDVQVHICFYPELVHFMFMSPSILRAYPVGFARSLLNLYEKHVGAKPGRRDLRYKPQLEGGSNPIDHFKRLPMGDVWEDASLFGSFEVPLQQ